MRVIKNKLFVILSIFLLTFAVMPSAMAAPLTSLSDTMSRLKASTASNHTLVFTTPNGIASGNTVTLTFPASTFTMGASLSGVTIADGAGADNAVTSASYSSNVLTITASGTSTVVATHVATIKIPSAQITNPTAGTYVITVATTLGDSGKVAVAVIADDQVVMSASVDPSFTFSISANTSAFGVLSTGSVATAGTNVTLTAATNGQGGYNITVRDSGSGSNPGLYNSSAGYLIGSADSAYGNGPTTLAAGTEGYGIYVSSTTGTPTIAARYNGGTGSQVGGLETTDTTILSRSSGMSANDTATVTHKAAISAWTKAGTYSDTLTYVATGNF